MSKKASETNNALLEFPEIVNYWDYEKNPEGPEDYTRQSGQKVWVKCKQCLQSTQRTVAALVKNPDACSVCSGKTVIEGFNDLASQNPRLAKEWSGKNELKSNQVIATGGRIKGIWNCSKGHEWVAWVAWRLKGTNCPYCCNQKVLKEHNSLEVTKPELLKYWDYNKNTILPSEITQSSNKEVWWLCENGHNWKAAPYSRWSKSIGVHGCNKCSRKKRRSKVEIELYEYCLTIDSTAINTYSLNKSIELDIFLPERRLAIEFNGDYWHSEKLMKEKYGLSSYKFHEDRVEKCKQNNITLLFVWESDWKNNKEDVKAALIKYFQTGDIDALLLKLKGEVRLPASL